MSDDNIVDLDQIVLTQVAYAVYMAFADRVAHALFASGALPKDADIPDEKAKVEVDGCLKVYVDLPNGATVSATIPKEHWAWAKRQ